LDHGNIHTTPVPVHACPAPTPIGSQAACYGAHKCPTKQVLAPFGAPAGYQLSGPPVGIHTHLPNKICKQKRQQQPHRLGSSSGCWGRASAPQLRLFIPPSRGDTHRPVAESRIGRDSPAGRWSLGETRAVRQRSSSTWCRAAAATSGRVASNVPTIGCRNAGVPPAASSRHPKEHTRCLPLDLSRPSIPSIAVRIHRIAGCQEYKPPSRARTVFFVLFLLYCSPSVAIAAAGPPQLLLLGNLISPAIRACPMAVESISFPTQRRGHPIAIAPIALYANLAARAAP